MSYILQWILPALIYSGPLFTFGVATWMFRSKRNARIFKISMGLHLIAFVPLIVGLLTFDGVVIHMLIWPSLTGVVLFVGGLIFLAREIKNSKGIA